MSSQRVRVELLGARADYRSRAVPEARIALTPRRGPAVLVAIIAATAAAGTLWIAWALGDDRIASWIFLGALTLPFFALLGHAVVSGLRSRLEITVDRDALTVRDTGLGTAERIGRRDVKTVTSGGYGERVMLYLVLHDGRRVLAADLARAELDTLAEVARALRETLELAS